MYVDDYYMHAYVAIILMILMMLRLNDEYL